MSARRCLLKAVPNKVAALALAVLSFACATTVAHAQVPVVLVPGFHEASYVWTDLFNDLSAGLGVGVITPVMSTEGGLASQGTGLSQLLSGSYSVAPSTGIALGHSNGGLVSREVSRTLALRGIVTFGSPHRGVPITNAVWAAQSFATDAVSSVADLFFNADAWLFTMDSWEWYDDVVFALFYAEDQVSAMAVAASMRDIAEQLVPQGQLLDDDTPGSAYLASLNSASNLATEATRVRNRTGISVTPQNWYMCGPGRIGNDPGGAYACSVLTGSAGIAFVVLEGLLLASAQDQWNNWSNNGGDFNWLHYMATLDLALSSGNVAYYLLSYENAWCQFVNGLASCLENDGLIPTYLQGYPGAPDTTLVVSQLSHTEEWRDFFVIQKLHQKVQAFLQAP